MIPQEARLRSVVEDHLAENLSGRHALEACPRVLQRMHRVDDRTHAGYRKELCEAFQLVPGPHRGTKDTQLQKKHTVKVR